MIDITTIPTSKLECDLYESNIDIKVCKAAIECGVSTYSGGSVEERLNANKHFVKVITTELERRNNQKARIV